MSSARITDIIYQPSLPLEKRLEKIYKKYHIPPNALAFEEFILLEAKATDEFRYLGIQETFYDICEDGEMDYETSIDEIARGGPDWVFFFPGEQFGNRQQVEDKLKARFGSLKTLNLDSLLFMRDKEIQHHIKHTLLLDRNTLTQTILPLFQSFLSQATFDVTRYQRIKARPRADEIIYNLVEIGHPFRKTDYGRKINSFIADTINLILLQRAEISQEISAFFANPTLFPNKCDWLPYIKEYVGLDGVEPVQQRDALPLNNLQLKFKNGLDDYSAQLTTDGTFPVIALQRYFDFILPGAAWTDPQKTNTIYIDYVALLHPKFIKHFHQFSVKTLELYQRMKNIGQCILNLDSILTHIQPYDKAPVLITHLKLAIQNLRVALKTTQDDTVISALASQLDGHAQNIRVAIQKQARQVCFFQKKSLEEIAKYFHLIDETLGQIKSLYETKARLRL
jgi:hypothetical protein